MNAALDGIQLIGGWLPLIVDLLAVGALTLLIARVLLPVSDASRDRRVGRLVGLATGAIAGVVVGLTLCWLLSDQLNLFDVSLTPISRAWVAGAFAAAGLAMAGIVLSVRGRRHPGRRRGLGLVATAAVGATVFGLLAGTLGVNADFGQYTTLGSISGTSIAAPLPASVLAVQGAGAPGRRSTAAGAARPLWRNAVDLGMPTHGLVGSVTIPATVSHFAARGAYVYLPSAALLPHPVALPVLIMLAGQPGSPSNVFSSGQIASVFDSFAAAHGGLAPIVVVPDQLGAPDRNPMCVNGSLGASATYLTVDVPNWIRSHLTVEQSAAAWAIGGFSQGATCSIQLGAAHPELFSAIIDISGQWAPKNGGLSQTIGIGFGGDAAAYRAAMPAAMLAANAPYRNTVAVFGVGQLDSRYGPIAGRMTAAASSAGIRASEAISPGTGHDWHTVQWVLRNALDPVYSQLGLLKIS
ncbi:alpha/beta hydrolase-fold protein [soil metagenome]